MNTEHQRFSREISGKKFFVDITDWAEQANGSVLVRLGDTLVLATAVMSAKPREGGDFFPLTVDYEEKFYAAGRILGSRFVKRETRPSEEATLGARLIDRAIRPRFDLRMRNEVQVVLTVLSLDGENDPDILALLGASLALSLSDIPWAGPVAGVRVARTKESGGLILNPVVAERDLADLDLVIAGTRDRVNMMEAGAHEISENDFAKAVLWGDQFIKELVAFQDEICTANPRPKTQVPLLDAPQELHTIFEREFAARLEQALYTTPKQAMRESTDAVRASWHQRALEEHPHLFQKAAADYIFDDAINEIIHRNIIGKGIRPDGRKSDELRSLRAAVGLLPRVHGSGLFMRGETHVLSSLTLGAPGDEQIVEGMEVRAKRRFLHHYNFPPFSTGEVKPMRGPGRREIGHGALAGRALMPFIPPKETFPYTIRIVSEVLSSNGSSSMASVCGSALALMDAGVPIKKLVAGAAMGLVMQPDGAYRVLTDIQGPEDHFGDMDFKVAGTRDGITAVQMDVKIEGVTHEIIRETLAQANRSRMEILTVMEAIISEPREELSPWAPRVTVLKINPEKIGALIGPGGKVINDIIAQTNAQIDIEDDGTVFITSPDPAGMEKATAMIKQITREIKAGELLEGRVSRVLDFGAMVEVGPRQDGLIHISELAPWRVERVTDIVNVGDVVPVKVKNIDEQGRVNLSLKDVPGRYSDTDIQPHAAHARPHAPHRERPEHRGRHARAHPPQHRHR